MFVASSKSHSRAEDFLAADPDWHYFTGETMLAGAKLSTTVLSPSEQSSVCNGQHVHCTSCYVLDLESSRMRKSWIAYVDQRGLEKVTFHVRQMQFYLSVSDCDAET